MDRSIPLATLSVGQEECMRVRECVSVCECVIIIDLSFYSHIISRPRRNLQIYFFLFFLQFSAVIRNEFCLHMFFFVLVMS